METVSNWGARPVFITSTFQDMHEAQADSYGLMGRMFDRARRVAATADDDEAFEDVVRDLGREALAENAEWLLNHRRRKIEQKA